MDPVPDPLLLRKSGSAGNRTRASVSVARNSDHQTTETVLRQYTLPPSLGPNVLNLSLVPWCTISTFRLTIFQSD
jgi:hypothetical protein